MSEWDSEATPREALEWAMANTPGAGESLARAEVARLRATEAKFAVCVGLIERLDSYHDSDCPAPDGGWCRCDYAARVSLRKLAES